MSREDLNPHPVEQDKIKQSNHAQPSLIDITGVKELLKEVKDVSAVDASVYEQDHVEDIINENRENSDSLMLVDQMSEQEPSTQRSPARSFSSIISYTLGKARPYTSLRQDSENDSCFELETEMSSDDCSNVLSPSPSMFSISESLAPKRMLLVDVLHAFWDICNKDSSSIISRRIALVMKDVTNGRNAGKDSAPSSRSTSSTLASATASSSWATSSSPGAKRSLSEDGLPPDGGGRRPLKPNKGELSILKDQLTSRYACPFRKHNPRKYNMYHH